MKHELIHIIYMSAMLLLFPACTGGKEDIPSAGDGKMQVVFTLAMNMNASGSRGTWEVNTPSDIGNDLDNRIGADGLKVLLYEKNGTYIDQVRNLAYYRTADENIYQFIGDISLSQQMSDVKVGVFANCGENGLTGNLLSNLQTTLGFEVTAAIPESIPMWGVKDVNLNLQPGTRQDLGDIHILRAMAKVEVELDGSLVEQGYALNSVAFPEGSYNNSGWCMPAVTDWNSLTDTRLLDTEAVLNVQTGSDTKKSLLFVLSEKNTSSVAYVPEFKAGTDGPVMKIKLEKDGTAQDKEYTVKFAGYTDGTAGNCMDVVRNHWYKFTITKVGQETVTVSLQYQVMDWTQVDNGDLNFGDKDGNVKTINPILGGMKK